jgi:hypothetical protein
MLTYQRKYTATGELTLNRSKVLSNTNQPKDDIVNWLFLDTGKHLFSFVYMIDNPEDAKYNRPFKVQIAFTMVKGAMHTVKLHEPYKVLRGQENIGWLTISDIL